MKFDTYGHNEIDVKAAKSCHVDDFKKKKNLKNRRFGSVFVMFVFVLGCI